MKQLAVSKIRLDGGTQIREQLTDWAVHEYAEKMQAGKQPPPVVVFYDGQDYWCADGFHRIAAVKSVGATEVQVDVRGGTRRDAILFSVGANDEHGVKRSPADKRRAVLTLLRDEEWAQKSDRWIAEKCAVSHTFVQRLREESTGNVATSEPKSAESQEASGRTQGQDGKWRKPKPKRDPSTQSPPQAADADGADEPRCDSTSATQFHWCTTVDVAALSRLRSQRDSDQEFATLRRLDVALSSGPLGTRAARMRDFIIDGGEVALIQLGLDWTVTAETLNTAYRKAAAVLHPDRGGSNEAFSALTKAKELIQRIV